MLLARKRPQIPEGSARSSNADTSSERKTDVSTGSTPPPTRTRTEKGKKKGAEIRGETEGVKEVILKISHLV